MFQSKKRQIEQLKRLAIFPILNSSLIISEEEVNDIVFDSVGKVSGINLQYSAPCLNCFILHESCLGLL